MDEVSLLHGTCAYDAAAVSATVSCQQNVRREELVVSKRFSSGALSIDSVVTP